MLWDGIACSASREHLVASPHPAPSCILLLYRPRSPLPSGYPHSSRVCLHCMAEPCPPHIAGWRRLSPRSNTEASGVREEDCELRSRPPGDYNGCLGEDFLLRRQPNFFCSGGTCASLEDAEALASAQARLGWVSPKVSHPSIPS